MFTTVKLGRKTDWFKFLHFDRDGEIGSQVSTAHKKRSVRLGQRQTELEPRSILPPKMCLTELLEYHNSQIAKYLLNSNTFFQGKVGFYRLIMRARSIAYSKRKG